jgi:hypothetical protein
VTQIAAPATPSPPPRPLFLDAFARILLELRMCVGDRMKAAPALMPLALALLIDGRLQRLQRRFFALAQKALTGTLRAVRVRKPGTGRTADPDVAHPPPAAAAAKPLESKSMPRGPGWLLRLCPPIWTTWVQGPLVVGCRLQLERLLDEDAAFRALVTSDRRFARMLRPLMHMMSPDPLPAWLQLPARPRKARRARGRRARERRARERRAAPETSPTQRRQAVGQQRRPVARDAGSAAPPPPPDPPPTPARPYALVPDWTPTELTRAPRRTWAKRDDPGPPLIFRELW